MMAAFELKTGATVDHKLYMMRNPWGVSYFNKTWNEKDTTSWTSSYRSQVPFGVDPLTSQTTSGIFFVSAADFLTCFSDYQIAHYRDSLGYSDDWYDKDNDDGTLSTYEVTVPAKNGDLYFAVSTYLHSTVPQTCWSATVFLQPKVTMTIYKNDMNTQIYTKTFYDVYHLPYLYEEANYAAGDKLIITILWDWTYGYQSYPVTDYTLKIYSKQNLEIKEQSTGESNMWHMDGQFPSAFTKSHYRTETTKWTPDFKPKSMYHVWLVSNNVMQALNLVAANPHVLFVWW